MEEIIDSREFRVNKTGENCPLDFERFLVAHNETRDAYQPSSGVSQASLHVALIGK